jgi:hypothetical protein
VADKKEIQDVAIVGTGVIGASDVAVFGIAKYPQSK